MAATDFAAGPRVVHSAEAAPHTDTAGDVTVELEALRRAERRDANELVATGLGIGALGVASAAVLGATCPVCIIATPLLVVTGVYKRIKCRESR